MITRKTAKNSAQNSSQADVALGKQIRSARVASHMTQAVLADHLGLSFQQIQKYESGKNRVSAAQLAKISDALRTSLNQLYGARAEKPPAPSRFGGLDSLAMRAVKAFAKIGSKDARRRVVELAEALAEEPPPKFRHKDKESSAPGIR